MSFPSRLSELDRERFLRQSGSSTDHSLQQFFALLCLRLPRWTTSQKRFGLETLGIPLPTFSTHSFEVSPRLCSAFRCLQWTGSLLCKEILHPRFQIVPPMYYVCHQQDLHCTPAQHFVWTWSQLWQLAVWTHGTLRNLKPQQFTGQLLWLPGFRFLDVPSISLLKMFPFCPSGRAPNRWFWTKTS